MNLVDKWRCIRCARPLPGDADQCANCGWLQQPVKTMIVKAINPKSTTQLEAPTKSAQVTKVGREGSQEAKAVREDEAPVL